ncbi:winged helix DNA-binding domain-containing protein [Nakamurella sp. GG22]
MTLAAKDARRLRRLRLTAQRIGGSGLSGPAEVVRWMLALQAQDLPGAKWSVGLRTPGSTLADVDDALGRGEIIRSWPMRGTLHLVPADDIGWMLELTAPRTLRALTSRHRELGIDEAAIGAAADVAASLLAGGGSAGRADILTAFEEAGVSTAGQRGIHLLGALHQKRLLCQGPMRGAEQLFVLLDEWVPRPRRLHGDEALGEFVGRYLAGHGPATIADFCWWTKLPVKDARAGLAATEVPLEELVIDGVTYWMAPGLEERPAGSVAALPGFDELLLGYRDRSANLPEAYAGAIVPGNNGMFLSTIVSDGRVVGTWRRRKTAAGVTVTPSSLEPLSARVLARFADAVDRYGRFLGVPVTVSG